MSEKTQEEVCFECRRDYNGEEPPCDACNLSDNDFDEEDEDDEEGCFFIAIPRTNRMFTRPMVFITPNTYDELPRTDDMIVCDVCSVKLEGEFINCATFNDGYSIWGAYCDECRLEYQGSLPILSLSEAKERARAGLIPT